MQQKWYCFFVVAIVCAVGFISTAAYATTTFYEPFNYNDGSLEGNTNPTAPSTVTVGTTTFTNTNVWTHGGTHTAPSVVSGDLIYPNAPVTPTGHMAQISGSGSETDVDRIAIGGNYGEGSTLYFSMTIQVPSSVTSDFGATGSGSFFAGFQFNPTNIAGTGMNDATSSCGAALTVHSNGTGYSVGIAYRDLAAARVFDDADVLAAGQTVLLVGKLQINPGDNNDVATLYVNPDPGTEPVTGSAVSDATVVGTVHDYFYSNTSGTKLDSQLRSFILRPNSAEPGLMNVDEIRVGDDWASVTPEPTALSLLGIGALGLLSRRRRTASTVI